MVMSLGAVGTVTKTYRAFRTEAGPALGRQLRRHLNLRPALARRTRGLRTDKFRPLNLPVGPARVSGRRGT